MLEVLDDAWPEKQCAGMAP